jgi:sigma-B regulation protein RsbU (phosphoserine phosphatase)
MDKGSTDTLRAKLVDRRHRLEKALAETGQVEDLVLLVQQVDAALGRMDGGSFGQCSVCHEEVEQENLLANPFIQYCLCRLTPVQQDALQHDLDLAREIQRGLLPRQDVGCCGWLAHYRYHPAGPVSGDYCDILTTKDDSGDLYFAVADVSGKGISAALLMAHLNASFRSLIAVGLPLEEIVARQNRLLLESNLPSHYATMVCGRAQGGGRIDLCNAGHLPPLVARAGGVDEVAATGLPVGMIEEHRCGTATVHLDPGDTLLLYTDGLVEARDQADVEFGRERAADLLGEHRGLPPRALADAILGSLRGFLGGGAPSDDLSLMVVRRSD